ncbi:MAG: hypothetical protein JWL95_634, partial [Gemmatimonadetes bacterium]|nr:hypothetical protein [Gemmatimonadota bacterium]
MSRSSGERGRALAQTRADEALRKQEPRRTHPSTSSRDAASQLVQLQRTAGNGAVTQLLASRGSAPGTALEREADAVADRVLRTQPVAPLAPPSRDDGAPGSATASPSPHDAPPTVHDVLRSPGRPLDAGTRVDMQTRFGRDFSGVRVHDGPESEQSARDVNARAYTVGSHIVFDANRFSPGTHEGRRLLAHELTHVVQQSGTPAVGAELGAVGRGASSVPRVSSTSAGAVQRAPQDKDELMKRLAEVRAELSSGKGVRTPEATEKLKGERLQLETELGIATPLKPPSVGPTIDWGGGNLRGIPAEEGVLGANYPGATRLPKGFPGVDFVEGGTRTPLTGGIKKKGVTTPYTADSEVIEGGTAIQVKTLKNTADSYQKPNKVLSTLSKGLEDLANVKP